MPRVALPTRITEADTCYLLFIITQVQLPYSKYGVDLRVKFKEEQPLASLDGGKNSGGEKTYAYILYLDPRC